MEELLAEIHKLRESGKLIIVEGKKDSAALLKFGITNVRQLSKKPLEFVAEDIANETKDCVLLVDLDAEGKKLYSKLNHHLNQLGVRIDNDFRNFLFKKTKVRCIEGLDTYVENMTSRE